MTDTTVLDRANARLAACLSHEAEFVQLAKDDLRFLAGNADNGYQWPEQVRQARARDSRPCLTINQLPQFVRQVVNDARESRPSIKVYPVEDADTQLADVVGGLIRSIEQDSDAETAYDTALESAVSCGIGYWRVLTTWADEKRSKQKLVIKRIRNRFAVHIDPACEDACGADARFVFIEDWLDRAQFEEEFGTADISILWEANNRIRVVEYFERDPKTQQILWYKIGGNKILDQRVWPGRFIPIIRVVGEEYDLGGKVIYASLVRNAKDAQRQINYWESCATEVIALSPRAPFIGAEGQFEGHEREWANANTTNYAYLEYRPTTWNGQLAPPPQRQAFPSVPTGITQMMLTARDNLKATLGIYAPSLGATSSDTSGRAIMARQRAANLATFHFIDNLSRAIRHTGRILIDLVPKIYDTPRMLRIIGEDGNAGVINLQRVAEIFRLNEKDWGQFDVTVSTGPAYATRRAETAQQMSQLLAANPKLWDVAGDLLVKAFDWPDADKLAARLSDAREIEVLQQTIAAQQLAKTLSVEPKEKP